MHVPPIQTVKEHLGLWHILPKMTSNRLRRFLLLIFPIFKKFLFAKSLALCFKRF